MKRLILLAVLPLMTFLCQAQDKAKPEYEFTTVRENPVTPVKNQFRSGTCWCFSTLSFLESELLRTQKKEYDLSRMWIVAHSYSDRAVKYVRMDGHIGFGAGSCCGDVLETIRLHGMVPESVYSGMQYGYDLPTQNELDLVMKAYVNAIIQVPGGTRDNPRHLSTVWKQGINALLQTYLGEWPANFEYEGKTMTPAQFRDEVLKFNADDYVNICSFSDRPLYKMCDIEVCDNWRNFGAYNVTMDEMMRIIYNAIDNGYTVAWGGDVSEKGFTRDGLAVMPKPEEDKKQAGSDQEHWVGKEQQAKDSTAVKDSVATRLPEEVEVSDSLRLAAYDNKLTTDDHGMHIYGTATDQEGHKYFKVKNSWGKTGKYDGIWYMSETFIAYKTLNIVLHKDALPKDLKKKLELK